MAIYILIAIGIILPLLWKPLQHISKQSLKQRLEKQRQGEGQVILYLRAFSSDGSRKEVVPSITAPLFSAMGNQLSTFEFDLADTLSGLGYLVAVGKPGEKIPEIGFERRYYPDGEWQSAVKLLIRESAMIIYRPDYTDGVIWEYEQIKVGKFNHKVWIWTQMGDDSNNELQKVRYNIFRQKIFEKFGDDLPAYSRYKKFLYWNAAGQWESKANPAQTPIFKIIKQNRI